MPPWLPAGELLLNLSANITNWDAATASVPGAAWEAGTDPCGGNGAEGWKGVTCSEGNVTELRLPGLGLNGQLPAQLAQLQSLEVRRGRVCWQVGGTWGHMPSLLAAPLGCARRCWGGNLGSVPLEVWLSFGGSQIEAWAGIRRD